MSTVTADIFLNFAIIILILFQGNSDSAIKKIKDEKIAVEQELEKTREELKKAQEKAGELDKLKEGLVKFKRQDYSFGNDKKAEVLLFCGKGQDLPSLTADGPSASYEDLVVFLNKVNGRKKIGVVQNDGANQCYVNTLRVFQEQGIENWTQLIPGL
ncbi:MAG: hypothetical protein WC663_00005 [Patescibacteria group bacterium]|jgi:hypothetical protein